MLKILNIYADKDIVRKFARKDKPFTMGMAASQGRLLFMTARISNNEFEQQCVAYSKQRLADDSQEANDQYLEALQATQYQILTGYNGESPNYEPVTYNQLTAMNAVATRKQYVVSDNRGQILVTQAIADAFGDAHTDFNTFLKRVEAPKEYTQVNKQNVTEADVHDAWDKYFASINKGDKDGIFYDENLNLKGKHVLGFAFHESKPTGTNGKPIAGADSVIYATYNSAYVKGSDNKQIFVQEGVESNGNPYFYYDNIPVEVESYIQYDGTIGYQAKFMAKDYLGTTNMMDDNGYVYLTGLKITSAGNDQYIFEKEDGTDFTYTDENGNTQSSKTVSSLYIDQNFGSLSNLNLTGSRITRTNEVTNSNNTIFFEGSTAEQRDLYDYAMAVTEKYAKGSQIEYDADKVQYYKNIYTQMITKGFTTFDKMLDEKYINTISYDLGNGTTAGINDENQAYKNDRWLISLLKSGKLSIAYYDSTAQDFIKTTLDDDESIVEKENKTKMAIAEQVYQNHMDRIESEDKRFDMQLSKLESEHTALTTEYDSVAKIISKNVEKSFNIFNA